MLKLSKVNIGFTFLMKGCVVRYMIFSNSNCRSIQTILERWYRKRMNIAVISSQGIASGKTSFVSLLASVFAHTQQKRVAIFSTDRINELLGINETKETASLIKSANIYRAQLLSATIKDQDIWDYGFRLGEEEVFAFDIAPRALPIEEQKEIFSKTLARVKTPMALIELKGDPFEELNKFLLESCDVVLYVFNQNVKDFEMVRKYKDTVSKNVAVKTGYICQRFDANIMGEKMVARQIGVQVTNLMQIPYNAVIAKECVDGKLNTIARFIAKGHYEVLNIRPKILEVMQYLYDTGSKKYIKGVEKWAK